MPSQRTLDNLLKRVDALEEDRRMLTAIIYRNIKVLTYLEYSRGGTPSFDYTPLTTSLKYDDVNTSSNRGAAPSILNVPTLKYLYRQNLTDELIRVKT